MEGLASSPCFFVPLTLHKNTTLGSPEPTERRWHAKREIALRRAEELKDAIKDYLEAKDSIPRGMAPAQQEQYERQKAKILAHLGGTEEDWNSYKWQLKNRISDLETLRQIIHLEDDEIQAIAEVEKEFRWGFPPITWPSSMRPSAMTPLSSRPYLQRQSCSPEDSRTPWGRNSPIQRGASPGAIPIG